MVSEDVKYHVYLPMTYTGSSPLINDAPPFRHDTAFGAGCWGGGGGGGGGVGGGGGDEVFTCFGLLPSTGKGLFMYVCLQVLFTTVQSPDNSTVSK